MQPIDYSIDVVNPFESALQGVKYGAGLQQLQAQKQEAQLKMQQEQAALQRQQALQGATLSLVEKIKNKNATFEDFAQFNLLAPKDQAEAAQRTWETMSKADQQDTLNIGGQLLSASGVKPELAVEIAKKNAAAYRNAGREDKAKAMDTWAQLIEINPAGAQATIGQLLASVPGGDKIIESWTKIQGEGRTAQEFTPTLAKKKAEATQEEVKAKFAESNALLGLEKQGWDIKKIKEDIDIAKQNARIAAMNASIAREGNELKRTELGIKIQEAKDKRDESVRAKVAEASTAAAQSDNLLNTVEKALNMSVTGKDKNGKPLGFTSTIESATGPIESRLVTIGQDVADFEEVINTLGSQVTMSRIGEMKGALSDKDMAVLQSSLQSLSLRQSPKTLVDNLLEIQRLTQKARKTTMDKFGAPAKLSVPDTPSAQPSPSEIDAILKKYGAPK